MPEISRFFGVRMYLEAGEPHHLPHFHAYQQDEVAVFGLDPIELISGALGKRQSRLVEAWAELHLPELMEDWRRLQSGRKPLPIEPLRQELAMRHPIFRVQSFEIVGPYVLRILFDDNKVQTINFRPILAGELYGPLRDVSLFNQVRIDPEVQTLVWPNGADFDPATLHDWPEHVAVLTELARQWDLTPLSSNPQVANCQSTGLLNSILVSRSRTPLPETNGPFRYRAAEFLQQITISSTGALEDGERMIGSFDDVQLCPAPEVAAHRAQQLQLGQFVSRALQEQHRYSDGLQVSGTFG